MHKSISVEKTFATDLTHLSHCIDKVLELHHQLINRMKTYTDSVIKNQFVKVKFNDFTQTTAECTSMDFNMDAFQQLCQTAYQRYQLPVRLLGVGVHFRDDGKTKEAASEQLF